MALLRRDRRLGANLRRGLGDDAVAMPSGGNVLDGSAPLTSPLTLSDGTVAPIGSYVTDTDTAVVVSYPDGSSRILYKNAPPPDDAQCANLTTADINRGVICYTDASGSRRYIPTEMATGQVQSWGELSANMERAAQLNAQYPDAARRNVWFYNPSWHFVGDVWDSSRAWNFAPDYMPTYIGPTTTSGGAQMFVVDPETDTRIDVTGGIAPEDEQRVEDLLYGPVEERAPGQPGYVPPVYSGPPIDETGSVIHDDDPGSFGGGNGSTRPPVSGPVTTPGGGGVQTTVNVEPTGVAPNNTAMILAAAAAAFFLFGRKR